MGKDSNIIFLEILIMNVDVIEIVSPEEFIQDKLQVPAEFVFE
jgi:hypothetical protein